VTASESSLTVALLSSTRLAARFRQRFLDVCVTGYAAQGAMPDHEDWQRRGLLSGNTPSWSRLALHKLQRHPNPLSGHLFIFLYLILRLTRALVNGARSPTLAKTGRCSPNEMVAAVVY
jgi:hypothetical protein